MREAKSSEAAKKAFDLALREESLPKGPFVAAIFSKGVPPFQLHCPNLSGWSLDMIVGALYHCDQFPRSIKGYELVATLLNRLMQVRSVVRLEQRRAVELLTFQKLFCAEFEVGLFLGVFREYRFQSSAAAELVMEKLCVAVKDAARLSVPDYPILMSNLLSSCPKSLWCAYVWPNIEEISQAAKDSQSTLYYIFTQQAPPEAINSFVTFTLQRVRKSGRLPSAWMYSMLMGVAALARISDQLLPKLREMLNEAVKQCEVAEKGHEVATFISSVIDCMPADFEAGLKSLLMLIPQCSSTKMQAAMCKRLYVQHSLIRSEVMKLEASRLITDVVDPADAMALFTRHQVGAGKVDAANRDVAVQMLLKEMHIGRGDSEQSVSLTALMVLDGELFVTCFLASRLDVQLALVSGPKHVAKVDAILEQLLRTTDWSGLFDDVRCREVVPVLFTRLLDEPVISSRHQSAMVSFVDYLLVAPDVDRCARALVAGMDIVMNLADFEQADSERAQIAVQLIDKVDATGLAGITCKQATVEKLLGIISLDSARLSAHLATWTRLLSLAPQASAACIRSLELFMELRWDEQMVQCAVPCVVQFIQRTGMSWCSFTDQFVLKMMTHSYIKGVHLLLDGIKGAATLSSGLLNGLNNAMDLSLTRPLTKIYWYSGHGPLIAASCVNYFGRIVVSDGKSSSSAAGPTVKSVGINEKTASLAFLTLLQLMQGNAIEPIIALCGNWIVDGKALMLWFKWLEPVVATSTELVSGSFSNVNLATRLESFLIKLFRLLARLCAMLQIVERAVIDWQVTGRVFEGAVGGLMKRLYAFLPVAAGSNAGAGALQAKKGKKAGQANGAPGRQDRQGRLISDLIFAMEGFESAYIRVIEFLGHPATWPQQVPRTTARDFKLRLEQ